ncbi:MAG: hypothetical protein JWM98_84 [Thermoleophilia bacterium]|nr:hypothetical protein [Thermoleophilia bacterium]
MRPAAARGADGPGVDRTIIPAAKLEAADPALRGKLTPPTGGKPPAGVTMHSRADGTRVLTVNIHAAVPASTSRDKRSDEDIDALRDVAAYVNSVNPDVVMVQEIRDRGVREAGGITRQASVLAHLMGATDMAFTPGTMKGSGGSGSGVYTRNGFTIGHAVNADLPNGSLGNRSAGVASINPPSGAGQPFSVISTHLSNLQTGEADQVRGQQLTELDRIATALRTGGDFTYTGVADGKRHTAAGFPAGKLMLGGDLNTMQGGTGTRVDSADDRLRGSGLRHANDLLQAKGGAAARRADDGPTTGSNRRIDHVYLEGFDVTDTAIAAARARELRGDDPTDHKGYIVDVR